MIIDQNKMCPTLESSVDIILAHQEVIDTLLETINLLSKRVDDVEAMLTNLTDKTKALQEWKERSQCLNS